MNKHVLITGVSRGIGLATAQYFLNQNFDVTGTATSVENIPIESPQFRALELNLLHQESIGQCIEGLANNPVDILINNAAISLGSMDDPTINLKKLRQTFEVNVFGLIGFCEKVIPLINKNGHIINISSDWGAFSGDISEFQPHYKMSKAALNMYTKTLSSRLKAQDICVSSLNPGWVKTDMGGDMATKKPEEAARDIYELVSREDIVSGCFWQDGSTREW